MTFSHKLTMAAIALSAMFAQGCRKQSSKGYVEQPVCSADGSCPVITPTEINQQTKDPSQPQTPDNPDSKPKPPPRAVPQPDLDRVFSFAPLTADKAEALKAKAEGWQSFGFTCPAGYPAKPSNDSEQPCDDGDSVIFNGLLCYSGNQTACQAVGDSQDSDGRWWRSPRRAAGEGRVAKTSFSRDQLIGVIFYLFTLYKTEPEEARQRATNWHSWIKANGDAVCTESSTTCAAAPLNWTLIARLFDHMKLPLDSNLKNYLGTESNQIIVTVIQFLTDAGFELHNYSASALAFAEMGFGKSVVPWANAITKVKGMEDNPFIELAGKMICAGDCGANKALDSKSLDQIANRVMELCPDPAQTTSNRSQWGWERATSEQAWQNSMGWDCVFMANLLAKASAKAKP